jgi:hypothetical protein
VDDAQILARIDELVNEENALRDKEAKGEHLPEDRTRLDELKVQLDRTWDLLRQRRAREEFGLDPDFASERSEETVEHYRQ